MTTWVKKSVLCLTLFLLVSGFANKYFEISKHLDIFTSLFKELNIYYVDETTPGDLMESAIDEMLKSLDPYTVYIPESEIEDFRITTTGQYGGIGSLIRKKDEYVIIVEPYKNSPAEKGGLKAGDKLLKINGKFVKGKSSDDVSKILKGEPNTSVSVLVERYGMSEPILLTLTREKIQLACVPYFGYVSKGVGYIRLTSFTDKATKSIRSALEVLSVDDKLDALILDLRGNPGGLLREAVNVCNLFLEKGVEIVSTKGKVDEWDKSYKTLNSPFDTKLPLVVLINKGSASASEIVSGTMQDLDRGVVLGEKSFGKGLVQQTRKLPYNSQLKVTIAKYYTPSGRCIQALDYTQKGSLGDIVSFPDSLKTEFKTKNGRSVFDGGGIDPDISFPPKKYKNITRALIAEHLIFDFATVFVSENKSILPPDQFIITDKMFESFILFLTERDFKYETLTDLSFEDLVDQAKTEEYYSFLAETLTQLDKKIQSHKESDLVMHKKEIASFLREEIASRYYYQEGRLISSLIDDDEVLAAINLLENISDYDSILNLP